MTTTSRERMRKLRERRKAGEADAPVDPVQVIEKHAQKGSLRAAIELNRMAAHGAKAAEPQPPVSARASPLDLSRLSLEQLEVLGHLVRLARGEPPRPLSFALRRAFVSLVRARPCRPQLKFST